MEEGTELFNRVKRSIIVWCVAEKVDRVKRSIVEWCVAGKVAQSSKIPRK